MIRIRRTRCPNSLAQKKPGRYNSEEIVAALFEMQSGKCCYCERVIPDEGHAKAVEHFRPKSIFSGLAREWGNLLLVCAQCNGKKSNKFPIELTSNRGEPKIVFVESESEKGEAILIDPSDPDGVDPEEHLEFKTNDAELDWGLVSERDKSARGRTTIDVTGIDSTYYVGMRRRHLVDLSVRYLRVLEAAEQAQRSGDTSRVRDSLDLLLSSTEQSAEFAALSREFVRRKKIVERVRQLERDMKSG